MIGPAGRSVGDNVGSVGADTNMYGSEIGAPLAQSPVVPGLKPEGAVFGWPTTANSLPVKLVPPLLRSLVGPFALHAPAELVVAAAQLALLEFTWTLLLGPPTICKVGLPLIWNGCEQLGWRTMMGTGAVACNTPHTALPATSVVRLPVITPVKVVWTRSNTFTRIKGFATVVVAGTQGGGFVGLHTLIPGTELGNLTSTSLDP